MTIELGNINKGIPMGSYAPGEGGGGAAKVIGVDPIAVTDGSIAIKIDEQAFQVNEQGELSANLNEIDGGVAGSIYPADPQKIDANPIIDNALSEGQAQSEEIQVRDGE